MLDENARAAMTASCRDTDGIPKVMDAGKVVSYRGETVQIMHNGVKVVAGGYMGDWAIKPIAELGGHHEPQEELIFDTLVRHARPQSLIVELGSFWAYYSLWYLTQVPDSRAICVEPDPSNMELGRKNAALNDLLGKIKFVEAWIGESFSEEHQAVGETTLKSLKLPRLDMHAILTMAGQPIEMLHIDTQGAELDFIRSIRKVDSKKQLRFVVVSTHHRLISGSATTHLDCIKEIESQDGIILCEHSVEESFSGDGLIVASFRREDASIKMPSISRNRAETSLFGSPLVDIENLEAEKKQLNERLMALSKLAEEKDAEIGRLHHHIHDTARAHAAETAVLEDRLAVSVKLGQAKDAEIDRLHRHIHDTARAHGAESAVLSERLAVADKLGQEKDAEIDRLHRHIHDTARAHGAESAVLSERLAVADKLGQEKDAEIDRLHRHIHDTARAHGAESAVLSERLAVADKLGQEKDAEIARLHHHIEDSAKAHAAELAVLGGRLALSDNLGQEKDAEVERLHRHIEWMNAHVATSELALKSADTEIARIMQSLAAIEQSRSWRLTRPLRTASAFVAWIRLGLRAWFGLKPGSRPRRIAKTSAIRLSHFVLKRRRLTAVITRTLRRFPRLERRIRDIVQDRPSPTSLNQPVTVHDLGRRASEIYRIFVSISHSEKART